MALYSRFFLLFRFLGPLKNTIDSAYIYIRETIDFSDHRFRVILLFFVHPSLPLKTLQLIKHTHTQLSKELDEHLPKELPGSWRLDRPVHAEE